MLLRWVSETLSWLLTGSSKRQTNRRCKFETLNRKKLNFEKTVLVLLTLSTFCEWFGLSWQKAAKWWQRRHFPSRATTLSMSDGGSFKNMFEHLCPSRICLSMIQVAKVFRSGDGVLFSYWMECLVFGAGLHVKTDSFWLINWTNASHCVHLSIYVPVSEEARWKTKITWSSKPNTNSLRWNRGCFVFSKNAIVVKINVNQAAPLIGFLGQ